MQPGVLGRLFAWGSAPSSAAPVGPSTHPATAIHFVPAAGGSLRLLVLTADALDCWQVLAHAQSPQNLTHSDSNCKEKASRPKD